METDEFFTIKAVSYTHLYTLLLDARDRQTKHRTTVQFELIQILGSGQG